jgi:hypothetical protein
MNKRLLGATGPEVSVIGFRRADQMDGILPVAGELGLCAEEIAFTEG